VSIPTNGTGDWHPRPLQALLDDELDNLEYWLDVLDETDSPDAERYAGRSLERAEQLADELGVEP
jgi:hypothetical protein